MCSLQRVLPGAGDSTVRPHLLPGVLNKKHTRKAGVSGLPKHLPQVLKWGLSSARDMKENITIASIVRKLRRHEQPQSYTGNDRR